MQLNATCNTPIAHSRMTKTNRVPYLCSALSVLQCVAACCGVLHGVSWQHLIFTGHFLKKSSITGGSFAGSVSTFNLRRPMGFCRPVACVVCKFHRKTLHNTATHCKTLHHIASHCKTQQDTARHSNTLHPLLHARYTACRI